MLAGILVIFVVLVAPVSAQQSQGGNSPPTASVPPGDVANDGARPQPGTDSVRTGRQGPGSANPSQSPLVISAALLLTGTDNATLTSRSMAQHDATAEARLNLHLSLPYGLMRGYVDYTLTGVHFARDSEPDGILNGLEAALSAELIEQHGFVDVSATTGQQLRSAFGAATLSQGVASEGPLAPTVANTNRVESSTYAIAPYLTGRLGDNGRMQARVQHSVTMIRGLDNSDFGVQRGLVLADSGVTPKAVRWKAQVTGAIYDFDGGRRTHEGMLRGDLGWAFDQGLVIALIGGREGNNFRSTERQYSSIYGASAEWRPSERTNFYGERLHRFFGNGHDITFNHRESRLAVTVADSRSVVEPSRDRGRDLGSAFDVLFMQFAGVEPDPVRRRALVQDTLARNSIDPSQQVVTNFVTNGVILERRQSVGLSWTHTRDIVTLDLSRVERRPVDTLVLLPPADDFTATDHIDQLGIGLSWAHRLTPVSTITLAGGGQHISGEQPSQRSTLRWGSVVWSVQLGQRATLFLNGRHDEFANDFSPYRVNTIAVGLRTSF